MRLPLFSENTLFATINIIHSRGLHSSTTALQQGGAQDTDSVAVQRWAASKEPSQGDSCGTEDFHPCNPRHQSSWAHWAQALGTARLRHTRLVVMGTFSRDTRCSTASPAGHWATRREWCWQYYLQLSLEYCFGLLQPYKQQFNFHNHPSANSHITDFVKDKISSQFVE